MICIESLDSLSSSRVLESARDLFLAYADFLRSSGEHDGFSIARLQREALDLPAAYAATHGAVLVAVVEGFSIGCIAFRAFPGCVDQDCCEIKRLFVLPEYRECGIGFRLASAALEQARVKGYRFAYLDTEPIAMAAAYRTYLKLGFVEYDRRGAGIGSVSFLRKSLI